MSRIISSMCIRGQSTGTRLIRDAIVRALLALFIVRALVPAGFMPDFAAAAKGEFQVVICTASGANTLALDADGKQVPKKKSHHADQPCAFAGLAAVALQTLDVAAIAAPEYIFAAVVPHPAMQIPPARAGPPLGSRGPPQLS